MAVAKIAFANLRAEMSRKNINITMISKLLGVTRGTAGNKLSRKQPITIEEAFLISETFFPEQDLKYLFAEVVKKD